MIWETGKDSCFYHMSIQKLCALFFFFLVKNFSRIELRWHLYRVSGDYAYESFVHPLFFSVDYYIYVYIDATFYCLLWLHNKSWNQLVRSSSFALHFQKNYCKTYLFLLNFILKFNPKYLHFLLIVYWF